MDKEAVLSFLESGFIPGVGKVLAQRILDTLDDRLTGIGTLQAEDFLEVPGIGEKAASAIISAINDLPVDPDLLIFLFSCGLTYSEITKIVRKYGQHTEKVVKENPYDMVEDVWKFSFFRADKIGKKIGIADDDPRRLQGALLTALKLHAEQGSLFATKNELISTSSAITGVDREKFQTELTSLISEERLIESLDGIYLSPYYQAEEQTARKLASLIKRNSNRDEVKFDLPEKDLEGHVFTEEQKNALSLVRDNPVTIITGDPGTGKTTTVRGLIRMMEDEGKKVILTAPTGRSAKKLETIAGSSAKTIHRILGFNRGKGYFNKKLDANVLIIDEASLLEQVLFNHLLQALGDDIKIVLVGDIGQLPPIGAGKVLEDMIDSGVVPVARLTRNFRQEQGSLLAANIQRIKEGELPLEGDGKDFLFIKCKDPETTKKELLELVTKKLPDKFGIAPADIQVVTPQHDGVLGTQELNSSLQEILQKDSPEISRGLKKFRLGDRVVQSENSSRRGVYNGETGKITDIDEEKGYLTVTFTDGKTSLYSLKDLGELSLAYATSVHKLQGTETDYLVIPLTMENEKMLYRNLLFTAVSRAKKFCALVGESEALHQAVTKTIPKFRNSNLKLRLQNYCGEDFK